MAVRVEKYEPAEGSNRPLDARAANDRIAEKAHRLRFHSRVPMLCECSAPGCQTIVMVDLDEYEQIRGERENFLTAPGHEVEGANLVEATPTFEIRQRSAHPRDGNGDRRSA